MSVKMETFWFCCICEVGKVLNCSKNRVDVGKIRYVITEICHGWLENGRNPDDIDSQFDEMVQSAYNSFCLYIRWKWKLVDDNIGFNYLSNLQHHLHHYLGMNEDKFGKQDPVQASLVAYLLCCQLLSQQVIISCVSLTELENHFSVRFQTENH